MQAPSDLEVDWANELISSGEVTDPEFSEALAVLCRAIESGALEHAGTAAEALALDGPHHDAELAYVLYFVSYSQEGFSVAWSNQADESDHYLGPVGDFRNEPMVWGLIQELGVSVLPVLDERALKLLRAGA